MRRIWPEYRNHVRIKKETLDQFQYVMYALNLSQGQLATLLGLRSNTISGLMKGRHGALHQKNYAILYPRLQELLGQAASAGHPRLVPAEPPKPYREPIVKTGWRSQSHRDNHREAMKAYWAKRRARDRAGEIVLVPEPATNPTITREGFFKRVYNAIVTGLHAA